LCSYCSGNGGGRRPLLQVRNRLAPKNIVGGDLNADLVQQRLELHGAGNVAAIFKEGLIEVDVCRRDVENLRYGNEDSVVYVVRARHVSKAAGGRLEEGERCDL
jgi:hypothetical protein